MDFAHVCDPCLEGDDVLHLAFGLLLVLSSQQDSHFRHVGQIGRQDFGMRRLVQVVLARREDQTGLIDLQDVDRRVLLVSTDSPGEESASSVVPVVQQLDRGLQIPGLGFIAGVVGRDVPPADRADESEDGLSASAFRRLVLVQAGLVVRACTPFRDVTTGVQRELGLIICRRREDDREERD